MENKNTNDLIKKIDSLKDSGERFDLIVNFLKEGVKLPVRYIQEVYDEALNCRFFNSDDYVQTARTFEKAGYNSLAKELYGIADELLNEQKAKRN